MKDTKNLFYRKKSHRYCRVIVHFSFSSSLKASSINSPFPSGFLLGCWFLHPRFRLVKNLLTFWQIIWNILHTNINDRWRHLIWRVLNGSENCCEIAIYVFLEEVCLFLCRQDIRHLFSNNLVNLIRKTEFPCSLLLSANCSLWKWFANSGKKDL